MRKILMLLCTICLVLSLTVSASAAALSFSDANLAQNSDEMAMLVDLGLISGYQDGTIGPRQPISRQEIAKLCSQISGELTTAASCPFTDVGADSWARPYIEDCYAKGIISGSSDGLFRPNDEVTAQELVKMLLVCIGIEDSGFTGANWAERVNATASSLGIYDGYYASPTKPLTRDEACLLIYNALQCDAVADYDETGAPVYHLDDLRNPQTLLEYRFGVTRYEQMVVANECADLSMLDGHLEPGYTKIEHHRAFQVSTGLDMIGRYVVIYAINDQVVVVPTRSTSEVYYTLSSGTEFDALLPRAGFTADDSTQYYINYNPSSREAVQNLTDHCEITVIDHTGDGIIDIVLATSYAGYRYEEVADNLAPSVTGTTVAVNGLSATDADYEPTDLVYAAWIGGNFYLEQSK